MHHKKSTQFTIILGSEIAVQQFAALGFVTSSEYFMLHSWGLQSQAGWRFRQGVQHLF